MLGRISLALAIVPFLAGRASGQAPDSRVVLERTACFGFCPVYRLEISADGIATFVGKSNVKTKSATKRLQLGAFDSLLIHLDHSGFFSLDSAYVEGRAGCVQAVTDQPYAILTVTRNGRTHAVRYYYGCLGDQVTGSIDSILSTLPNPNGPRGVFVRSAAYVDSIAGTHEWLKHR